MTINGENLKHGPREAICMEKPVETAWVGPKVGWGWASGNDQGGAKSVSQVDGVSDGLHPLPALWLGGGLRKGIMASDIAFLWEKASPQRLPLMPDSLVPPCISLMPFNLLPLHWCSEGVSPSKSV